MHTTTKMILEKINSSNETGFQDFLVEEFGGDINNLLIELEKENSLKFGLFKKLLKMNLSIRNLEQVCLWGIFIYNKKGIKERFPLEKMIKSFEEKKKGVSLPEKRRIDGIIEVLDLLIENPCFNK